MPSVTLTFSDATAARITKALKRHMDKDTITLTDLKVYIVDNLRQLVREDEYLEARKAALQAMAQPTVVDIT